MQDLRPLIELYMPAEVYSVFVLSNCIPQTSLGGYYGFSGGPPPPPPPQRFLVCALRPPLSIASFSNLVYTYIRVICRPGKQICHEAPIFRPFTAKTRQKCRFLVCALQSTNFVQMSQKFVDAKISAIARQGSNMAAHPSFAHARLAFSQNMFSRSKIP